MRIPLEGGPFDGNSIEITSPVPPGTLEIGHDGVLQLITSDDYPKNQVAHAPVGKLSDPFEPQPEGAFFTYVRTGRTASDGTPIFEFDPKDRWKRMAAERKRLSED